MHRSGNLVIYVLNSKKKEWYRARREGGKFTDKEN